MIKFILFFLIATYIFPDYGSHIKYIPFPPTDIHTPALISPRTQFTTHQEMINFLESFSAPNFQVEIIGYSQGGLSIPLVKFLNGGKGALTLLFQAQMHGSEPGAGESMLALISKIANGQIDMGNINLLIVPRANPDGSKSFEKSTKNGKDMNSDFAHAFLPETAALLKVFNTYSPHIVVDFHEYTATAIEHPDDPRKNLLPYYDILLLPPTNPNVDLTIKDLSKKLFIENIEKDLDRKGFTSSFYYNSIYYPTARTSLALIMGSDSPQVARNSYALQSSISLLVEGRGGGIGWTNFPKRVKGLLESATSILSTANKNRELILNELSTVKNRLNSEKGTLILKSEATIEKINYKFISVETGKVLDVPVFLKNTELQMVKNTLPIPDAYLVKHMDSDFYLQITRFQFPYEKTAEGYIFPTEGSKRYFIPLIFEERKSQRVYR